jgi:DNA-binding NarL/FixJ family response regulator
VRVVIAEDLFLLREGMASLLKELGFDVAEAVGDGPSLLAALTGQRPDVAIVDVWLPRRIPMRACGRRWRPGTRYRGCLS